MQGPDKDLQDLLHSQGELIGSIAHDLKGLINGIEGGMYFISSGMKKVLIPRCSPSPAYTIPRQLGPTRRIPRARQVASILSSTLRSPVASLNPPGIRRIARTPLAAHCSTTSAAEAAGTVTMARSTGAGGNTSSGSGSDRACLCPA